MDLTADLSQALQRRETKRQIAKLLERLSASDRKAVLLDLIADGDDRAEAPEPKPVAAGRPPKPAETMGVEAPGRTDTLLRLLTEQPGTSIGALATRVYGDAGESSRNKVRSLLASLKKRGIVKNVGTGEWEVVPQKP